MSEYISATLQEGSAAVAMAARPSQPQVIRARGDRRRRRKAAGLTAAALAVVAAGAGAYPLAHDLGRGPAATGATRSIVPPVAGETLPTAEHAIVRVGLAVGGVSRLRSGTVPAGMVIGTSPRRGASEPKGTRVSLVVSAGGGTFVVPNVVGMTEIMAEQIGHQLQMRVEVVPATSAIAAPGTVAAEEPAAGSKVARGSTIVLYVVPAKGS